MIEVVPGGAADRAAVAGFIGQLYAAHDHPWDQDALLVRADEMIAANAIYFLHRDGETIGYAALKEMGDHMFIRHFVIDAGMRREGVGSQAFRALEAACFPDRQVRLDASHKIERPRAFWEAQGFQVMGYTMRRDEAHAS
ncbi:MAG: GNAT family N-acetyltransferase [Pseudomonadota bacterium]